VSTDILIAGGIDSIPDSCGIGLDCHIIFNIKKAGTFLNGGRT